MKQMCRMDEIEYIIENPFVICGLVEPKNFLSRCKDLGINTSEEQLERLEKLGIFYPIARVQYPENVQGYIDIWSQKEHAINWFKRGHIWEPSTKPYQEWKTFKKQDDLFDKIRSFYSIFQFYPLHALNQDFITKVHYANFVEFDEKDREGLIESISYYSKFKLSAYKGEHQNFNDGLKNWWFSITKNNARSRAIAAKVCQIISNRYYPETQTDGRRIWVTADLTYRDWNWHQFCRDWNAKAVLDEIGLDIREIKALHKLVASDARDIDPLENWYELVRYISLGKKNKLKGTALLAQSIYSMEMMLRLFYQDITNEELPIQEVPPFKDVNELYGIHIDDNVLDHLEFITNEFNINPKPNLILFVEGDGEEIQFPRLSKELLGHSFSIRGIQIRNLKGIGNFTGKKSEDKYGALEKLIDEYHSRQTIVYIILDNEGKAKEIRDRLTKKPSTIIQGQTVTKTELIHLWERNIEFDNFSPKEIALAMTDLCHREYEFRGDEIKECIRSYDSKNGDPLRDLFEGKTSVSRFSKKELLKLLFDNIMSRHEEELIEGKRRPIVNLIIDIINITFFNQQPHDSQTRRNNQESGFFREKIK